MKSKKIIVLCALNLLFWSADLWAQIEQTLKKEVEAQLRQVRINSSPNLIGSGARAMGMGGAFIAVADDATAASWNPGGLIQLERPEFSFVFNFSHNRKELQNSDFPEMNGMNSVSREDLNYLSVAYPFRAFDKNMIISLNYQRLYDLYDEISFNQNTETLSPSGSFLKYYKEVHFKQSGGLKALAPAYAIQLTPQLSVGATFNFWTDNLGYDNEWESDTTSKLAYSFATPVLPNSIIKGNAKLKAHVKNSNFEAFNMNLGFLWRINSVMTLGGVYKTPYTASLDRRTRQDYMDLGGPGLPADFTQTTKTRESIEMHFPASYGLGIAFRLTDTFTTSFDVYRTEWSDYWVRSEGIKVSPVNGKTKQENHIHNTTQVRAGGEYLFVLKKTIIPLRMGVFYDPEPSEKHPNDFYGFSIGTGISLGPAVIDCAYVYRWGRDIKGGTMGDPGTKVDIRQHNFYVSMIYKF